MAGLTEHFLHDNLFSRWRQHLEHVGPPDIPVSLPAGDELVDTLRYLEIPEEDIADVVRLAPSPESDPEAWWYLQRGVHSLGLFMGTVDQPPRVANLKDINDPVYRFFYVHMFVAALPQVQAYFRAHRIPEEIVQQTLADLGRNVRVHRKREGIGGLGVAFWLTLHFRGMIYQLGRLQFERAHLGERAAEGAADMGIDVDADAPVLSIHIPDFCGPMSPEACNHSITMAHEFFRHYFPNEHVVAGICSSWLLDPQLKTYLSSGSNIIRFQNRFHLVPGGYDVNTSIVQFVFGPMLKDAASLPRRTTLERAVASHLESGKNWEGRVGWFPW